MKTETVEIAAPSSSVLEREIERGYTSAMKPGSLQIPSPGSGLEYEATLHYEAGGRLEGIQFPEKNLLSLQTYVPLGGNLIQSRGSFFDSTLVWDSTRDVLLERTNEGNEVHSSFTYTVNALGQRTAVETDGEAFGSVDRGWSWGYNARGEVVKSTHADDNAHDRAYAFDGIGNRITSTVGSGGGAVTTDYTANALNQYTAIDSGTEVNPVYDDDGNLLEDKGVNLRGVALEYTWDGENRLIEVRRASDDALVASYAYDFMSRRVRKTTTAAAPQGVSDTASIYDEWNPVAEYDLTGSLTAAPVKRFVWGTDLSGSAQGAGGVGGLLYVFHGGDAYAPTYDGNGNVSEYVDGDGEVVAHYEYDPFGKLIATDGNWEDFSHRFSTKPQDEETGFLYYGYRYYDPQTGRWPSRDPIEERGGMNLYGFVGNNGVNRTDLLGLQYPRTVTDKAPANTILMADIAAIEAGYINAADMLAEQAAAAEEEKARAKAAKEKRCQKLGKAKYDAKKNLSSLGKGQAACKRCHTCPQLRTRAILWRALANARWHQNLECYKPTDPGYDTHVKEQREAYRQWKRCESIDEKQKMFSVSLERITIMDRSSLKILFPSNHHPGLYGSALCDWPDDPEAFDNVKDFEGRSWTEINSDFWHGRESAIEYFSGFACCYFIPSVISSSHEDPEGIQLVAESVIMDLGARDAVMKDRKKRRWSGLSQIQRGCLAHWIISYPLIGDIQDLKIAARIAVEFLAEKNEL